MKCLFATLFLFASLSAFAQTVYPYDTFSDGALDAGRWQVINEQGTALAGVSTDGGILTVTGTASRTGAASTARLGTKGAVEVTALGWTGTNQILQLYSGTGSFTNFIEFGMEQTTPDGTPILHVWRADGPSYQGASPVPGPVSPSNPTVMRIERDGNSYKFLANGQPVYAVTSNALTAEARVVLYGWSSSVSQWDDVRISGPDARLDAPLADATVNGDFDVTGDTGSTAASWELEYGAGAAPTAWTSVASGDGPRSGALYAWPSEQGPWGTVTFRLTATDDTGASRSLRRTVSLRPANMYGNNPRPAEGRGFVFPNGTITVPIGENDGYPWPGLNDLWLRGDRAATDAYVLKLRNSGVNVMRIMLEAAGSNSEFLENPIGTYNPKVLAFWDTFFDICEKRGMTVLLTPWDTFWMNDPGANRWASNPYNAANGGPCATQAEFITSPAARAAQKARFKFMIDRWGNSKAIFAYDLLNEFDIWWNPATPAQRADWVDEMARYVRDYEMSKWGKVHMLTVSSAAGSPSGIIGQTVYRYPLFEFANTHQYYTNVNDPKDIIAPALEVNAGVRYSLGQIDDGRPYTDSESGPINHWQTDQAFDDLYYRAMAWAHFSSGGSGSGMRWPYRNPHYLSDGMHATQRALSLVSKDLDWSLFHPVNVDSRLSTNRGDLIVMGSADTDTALIWVIQDVRQRPAESVSNAVITFKGLTPGRFRASFWNPVSGGRIGSGVYATTGTAIAIPLIPFPLDLVITLHRLAPGDINADGLVSEADAALALQYAAGVLEPTREQSAGADINVDGIVDITDAALLARGPLGGVQ
jgi:mannan endo-1,4-beta-mannosidase